MNENNLVRRLSFLSTGDGYRRSAPINLLADVKDATGQILTGATVPAVGALETNLYGLVVVTGQTLCGKWTWVVPPDYDDAADELRILIACNTAGATADVLTLTPTIYRKRPRPAILPYGKTSFPAALALSSDLGCPASADTVPLAGANLLTKWVAINCDAKKGTIDGSLDGTDNRLLAATADASVKAGDILAISVNLSPSPGTHSDSVDIYGIEMWYRSNLAFTEINAR